MSSIKSLLKSFKSDHLLYVVAIAVIGYLVYRYNVRSASALDTMSHYGEMPPPSDGGKNNFAAVPAAPMGENEDYMKVDGGKVSSKGLPPHNSNGGLKAEHLLPVDNNSQFSNLNPQGKGALGELSFLQAGHHKGVDTQSNTMRNANLQLRSEPPIPVTQVGPFHNHTMGPDTTRPILEIGNQAIC